MFQSVSPVPLEAMQNLHYVLYIPHKKQFVMSGNIDKSCRESLTKFKVRRNWKFKRNYGKGKIWIKLSRRDDSWPGIPKILLC